MMYRNGMLSKLKDAGIELHVRSAFLQGLFFLPLHGLKDRFRDAIPHLTKLKSIASEANLTIPELSLLWLVSLEEVSRVIIGVDNMEQLKTHLNTLNKKVHPDVFEKALCVHYENENILNPSLWK